MKDDGGCKSLFTARQSVLELSDASSMTSALWEIRDSLISLFDSRQDYLYRT